MKYFLSFSLLLVFLCGCKKVNDSPQWDVDVLAPLFKATISVENLIADTALQIAPDGAVALVYNNDIFSTPVDSIFQIRDTSLINFQKFFGSSTLIPNSPFTLPPNTVSLIKNGPELKYAIIKKGNIRLTAFNRLATLMKYTYTIPKASKNGVDTFLFETNISAKSPLDTALDMSGWALNLTGTGTEFNKLTYLITITNVGDTIPLNFGDTLIDLKTTFEKLVPLYVKGYLGQQTFTQSSSSNTGLNKVIQGGLIKLDSVTATFSIKNNAGVDAQAVVKSISSINETTNNTVSLSSGALINRSINLNRAVETGPPVSPVIPYYYSLQVDNTNSNIVSFTENLPDKIAYDLMFSLNPPPLGNVSGHNDFIYTDDIFSANLKFNFPLRFAANQLLFADTNNFTLANKSDLDPLGDGVFTLYADNEFPYEIILDVDLLNENDELVDHFLTGAIVKPAPMDANFRSSGITESKFPIVVPESRKNAILNSSRIAVHARFSTASYPQVIQLYSNYKLNLQLVADATYKIR